MHTLFPVFASTENFERIRQKLLRVPQPRVVAVRFADQIGAAFGLAFLCVWATLVGRQFPRIWEQSPLASLLFPAIGVFIAASLAGDLRRELRNRSLVEQGTGAVGQITSQETVGGKSKRSKIVYEFTDATGQLRRGEGTDRTRQYFEGMPVVVFYEPTDPANNVAICATIWKLRDPDGGFFDLD